MYLLRRPFLRLLLQAVSSQNMPPACSTGMATAMATARAEQGMLKALGEPRVTIGNNPFVHTQAGA